MIDFDLKYRILPKPHDGLLSVYHLIDNKMENPRKIKIIAFSLRSNGTQVIK